MKKKYKLSYIDELTGPGRKKRKKKYLAYKKKHGFDPSELWNLDSTILKFIIPRLKEFKKDMHGYPPEFSSDVIFHDDKDSAEMVKYRDGMEGWKITLNMMILELEDILEDDWDVSPIEFKDTLFAHYFRSLWD